jgi:hypothetical protein
MRIPEEVIRTIGNPLHRTLQATRRLEDAVAGSFAVDARRTLTRAMTFLRYTRDGVEIAGTQTP